MHRFVFLYGSNNVFPTAQSETMSHFLIPVFQQKTSITNTVFCQKLSLCQAKESNRISLFELQNSEVKLFFIGNL